LEVVKIDLANQTTTDKVILNLIKEVKPLSEIKKK